MGRKPADLVIKDGQWVCVQSGEIIPHTDIAVCGEHIAYVGPDATHTIGEDTKIIQADRRYLVPGLLDGHMHIESGMLTVTEFVRAVIPHGTTGLFADPHEIANVLGLRGVRLMVNEAAHQPIHVWVQAPSCVPSAPGLETPGAILGSVEVTEALNWEGIIGLGEMMNFPGVIYGNDEVHAKIAAAIAARKVVSGHYASPDLGLPFHGYIAGGPEDDHEGTRLEDAVARARQGMRVMLRQGSGWQDVAEGVRALTEMGINPRGFNLCTDDAHCETLVEKGHVNLAVREAIFNKVPPITAIQMATINTAEHFGLKRDLGMIAPGRYADFLLVGDLAELDIQMVFAKGILLAEDKQLVFDWPAFDYPEWATGTVKLGREVNAYDFSLPAPMSKSAICNVIGIIEKQAPTRHLQLEVPIVDGEVKVNLSRDLAKVAIVERYKGTGRVQVGLVHGFGFNSPCAVASTVAHDCHQMIVVGTDESDMAKAANRLATMGGGQIVVKQGQIIGEVALPIAGLMSNKRAEIVAKQAASVLEGFRHCGCQLVNPNMQLSLLALVVIPELRISDLGLVDVEKFDFIPVLENK